MAEKVEVAEFARRVERVCDFLLSKYSIEDTIDGSADIRVVQDLKEQAADLHMIPPSHAEMTLSGLDAYMRGHPENKES